MLGAFNAFIPTPFSMHFRKILTKKALAYTTYSMQNTPIDLHILDFKGSLQSVPFTFKDHFEIAQKIISGFEFRLSLESETPRKSARKGAYLLIPPTLAPSPPTKREASLIKSYLSKGKVIACCGGVIKLAHLGVLDDKEVTSHWMFQESLKRNFPRVRPSLHKTLVQDQNIITTGGIQSYLDVICFIVKSTMGTAAARKYNQFVQGYGVRDFQIPTIEKKETELEKLFKVFDRYRSEELHLKFMANEHNMSTRSFQRHIKLNYKINLRKALKEYRIQKIKSLLEKGFPIKQISHEVGFQDDVSLRRFFKQEFKMPISEYRKLLQLI
ncbi:MAG: hypothetical protein CME64_01225 [Halobacteriovoraceae bacterium]|nr:hypothetical protein [Halobacteriovoraceae bacterium]